MSIIVNKPNLSPPAGYQSLARSTYWIHQNGGTDNAKIQFNRKGWQQLPKYVDLIVYDTSIDIEKGNSLTMIITDISNIEAVGQLQNLKE